MTKLTNEQIETIANFEKILPEYNVDLQIQHNPHKGLYESVEYFINDNRIDCFDSENEKAASIENDSLWVAVWYPHTPVGCYRAAASTLKGLIQSMLEDGE